MSIDDWFIWIEATRDTSARAWEEEVLPRAKSELLQLVLDVIGADEKITTNDGFGNEYEIDSPLNELRAEQRQKAKDLFGVKDVVR